MSNTSNHIWYTRCPVPTAFSIAIANGFLAAELQQDGIIPQSLASSSDTAIRQSHFNHSLPNSFRHGGNGPPLVAHSRGADTTLIGLSWNDSIKPMLVMPNSGIKSMADLTGKRISLPIRSSDTIDFWRATSLRGTELALQHAGMSFDDVIPTPVSTQRAFIDAATRSTDASATLWDANCMLGHQREEAFALIRGEVDAIYSQGAISTVVQGFTGAIAIADNAKQKTMADKVNNDAPLALTVSTALLRDKPELVARCLAAVLRAAGWASRNEHAAKRIIAADTGLPEELVNYTFSTQVHQQLAVDLRPEWIEGLKVQHDHLLRHGFLDQAIDFERFIDPHPLQRAIELVDADLQPSFYPEGTPHA